MPKSRRVDQGFLGGIYRIGNTQTASYNLAQGLKLEEMYVGDSGHWGWPKFNGRNVGGAFLLRYNNRYNGTVDVGRIQGSGGFSSHSYEGSMGTATDFGFPVAPLGDASVYGAEAWSKMKPDQPEMSGLNAIVELKDLPGMLKTRFSSSGLAGIGDYYLAQKFGWDPLLRDIRDFIITQIKSQEILKQLIRDNGKPVRRAIKLSDTRTAVNEGKGPGNLGPQLVTGFYRDPSGYHNVISDYQRVWASAQFVYHLPDGPKDIKWTAQMKRRIFGFRPSPAVVYNAMPWSWLVDWFLDVGYLVDNLQTNLVDRLAANYFYVMMERGRQGTNTVRSTYYRYPTGEPFTVTATGLHKSGIKTRVKGDPFGWGTADNSLSGVQTSILGALGLSRLR